MSARNGDRSRFGRLRKQKMRRREATLLRLKKPAPATAPAVAEVKTA